MRYLFILVALVCFILFLIIGNGRHPGLWGELEPNTLLLTFFGWLISFILMIMVFFSAESVKYGNYMRFTPEAISIGAREHVVSNSSNIKVSLNNNFGCSHYGFRKILYGANNWISFTEKNITKTYEFRLHTNQDELNFKNILSYWKNACQDLEITESKPTLEARVRHFLKF